MRFSIKYTHRRFDLIRYDMSLFFRKSLFSYLLAVAAAFAIPYFFLSRWDNRVLSYLPIVMLFCALPYVIIYSTLVAMQDAGKHTSMTADAEGVEFETRDAKAILFWRGVSSLSEMGGFLVLKVGKLQLLIPGRAFPDRAERAQFKAFVQDMIRTHGGQN